MLDTTLKDIQQYRTMLECARAASRQVHEGPGAGHGVVLYLDENLPACRFIMWGIDRNQRLVSHELYAANTSQERLNAHVLGFVSTFKAANPVDVAEW